jgi:acyl carrier protein
VPADAVTNGHASAAPQPAPSSERIQEILVEVIAEKTGYPADMLDLGMALDTDLGIDSIKRVEILSALQERLPEAPTVKPEHLGSLHTLRDIAAFLSKGNPSPERKEDSAEACLAPPLLVGEGPSDRRALAGRGCDLARSALCAVPFSGPRSAIDLPTGAEVWVSDDDPNLASALETLLVTRGHRVRRLRCMDVPAHPVPARLAAFLVTSPSPSGEVTDDFLLAALMAVKHVGPALSHCGGTLLTISRLDGAFGLDGTAPPRREPIDGGLAGLAKTVAQEWPHVRARAVDLTCEVGPSLGADGVFKELFLTGPVEVGLRKEDRVTLELQPLQPLSSPEERRVGGVVNRLQPGDLVIVSGGARG